ncbi:MAG: metallophosphoesterase family protein, partial [Pseudomonadales bacterium]
MKILAFSDIHRNVDVAQQLVSASQDADVLIGAGDFGTRGQGASDTIDILKSVQIPTIIVSGNHDSSIELEGMCSNWKLGHFLHGTSIKVKDFTFFGLG